MNNFEEKLLQYGIKSRKYLADKTYKTEAPCIFVVPSEAVELLEAKNAQLARLRDNYKATSELLAIREEQIGELLNEKAQLRATLDKEGAERCRTMQNDAERLAK